MYEQWALAARHADAHGERRRPRLRRRRLGAQYRCSRLRAHVLETTEDADGRPETERVSIAVDVDAWPADEAARSALLGRVFGRQSGRRPPLPARAVAARARRAGAAIARAGLTASSPATSICPDEPLVVRAARRKVQRGRPHGQLRRCSSSSRTTRSSSSPACPSARSSARTRSPRRTSRSRRRHGRDPRRPRGGRRRRRRLRLERRRRQARDRCCSRSRTARSHGS